MKIGVKITLLAIIALIGVAIVSISSLNSLSSMNDLFTDLGVGPFKNSTYASTMLLNVNVMARHSASLVGDTVEASVKRKVGDHNAAHEKFLAAYEAYKKNARTERVKEILGTKLSPLVIDLNREAPALMRLFEAHQFEEAAKARNGHYRDLINEITEASQSVYEFAVDVVEDYAFVRSNASVDDAIARVMMFIAIVVIALSVVSIIIIMGVTKPLKRAVTAATQISEGNFDVDLTSNSKDETGTLMRELTGVVQTVKNVVSDVNTLAKDVASEGNFEARLEASKYKGSYRELAQGINKMIEDVTLPFEHTSQFLSQIARGEIPAKITTQEKGKFAVIRDNLNQCFDALRLIVTDINSSIEKAVAGDLKYRADVTKHQGDYRKIMEGVNKLVEAFVLPLEEVSRFLQDVEKGDESMRPIAVELKGEFNTIKNNANALLTFLNRFLAEIMKVGAGAKAGNLAIRTDGVANGAWLVMEQAVDDVVIEAERIVNDVAKTMKIMATGDLTPRITADYKGQFADVKNDINLLGDSLTDLISQLQEAIHTTATASAEISATADTLAAATHEQSSQTDEVASAMEEMARTVVDNASSAIRTADVAKQSGEVANNGSKVVSQTVNKMREIAGVVKHSADNIAKLGDSSKKIGEIIGVIDDIADQTNLLSLNAAIEAARAGEQGRGFAVVADSVGKLAVSTASATKEIAGMIKGIQTDTEAAVKAMEKGTSEVQSGIELADNAGSSLQGILTGINDLLDMVNHIAAASEQQSATSEQISKNVTSISKVTADSAKNIEDVASTANELAKMTDTLTRLVSQFKVNPSGGSAALGRNNRYLN